jgi:integrase
LKATPHTFRHQAITWLTRHSGMADAELQLITGHAKVAAVEGMTRALALD